MNALARMPAPSVTVPLPIAPSAETPDGTPAARVAADPVPLTIPAAAFGPRGTIAFWLKLPRTIRRCETEVPVMASDAMSIHAIGKENFAQLLLTFGPAMVGEEQAVIRGLLTHLKADQWYHVAFTWDGETRNNHFILDGLDQGTPEPKAKAGIVHGVGDAAPGITMALGSPGLAASAPQFWDTVLPASVIASALRAADHERYEDEGINYTDETLSVDDFPSKRPVYETDFDDPAELDNWVREGGESATIADGRLKLQTGPSPEEGQHLVLWLRQELPADFLAEWTMRPYDKTNGLTIVVFNARGRNGEDLFDPGLRPRNGEFVDYHSGDLDNYHISYYAGHRGSVNLRKNYGFYLAALGAERVHTSPPGPFHRITLLKQGGKIRLATDGIVSLKFDDDGTTYAPVHAHPGRLGLRQMLHSWYTEYEYFRAWEIG